MTVPLPSGFTAGSVYCGLKQRPSDHDLGLIVADEPRPAAAVFTRNRLNGAHIPVCRSHLKRGGGLVRAVLVNSGNANCATGPEGISSARRLCEALAQRIGCPTEQVLMMSTGVIGAALDVGAVERALDPLLAACDQDGGPAFARAIMTTDTFPKTRTSASGRVAITGFAKGAGMVHPDMATMLAFLLVDGCPSPHAEVLARVVAQSFHRVTVDGDTSPNDTVLLWGGALEEDQPGVESALTSVAQALARDVARDGEGATRLLTVRVSGAVDASEATQVGRAVARSPLVKTAVAGRDPNWGRILSAASSAGVPLDPEKVRLSVGDAEVYRAGRPLAENEGAAHRHMVNSEDVRIALDLGRGDAVADVWSCDLTADYVRINADYRS
jgi:glutamate N-acetyltransferase/amino-acid N-acetyltransferase